MKIAIVHLSDLHLKPNNEKLLNCIDAICDAIHLKTSESKQLFIVYSGDLVDRGQSFKTVKEFVTEIEEKIKAKVPFRIVKNVFVPGNHDCVFIKDDEVRPLIINSFKGKDDTSEQLIETLIACQTNFWDFYKEMIGGVPENKLNYTTTFPLSADIDLSFNCFNTSWISTEKEKPGEIIFPLSKIVNFKPVKKTISIAVFHHPLQWLSPNTVQNNRKMFQRHIMECSNLVLTGHEHTAGGSNAKDIFTELSTYFVESDSLNEGGLTSGFNVIEIDLNNLELYFNKFLMKEGIFTVSHSSTFPIPSLKSSRLQFSNEYILEMSRIPIPISHPNRTDLSKWDLFIYPDLEPIIEDGNGQYIEASEILLDGKNKIIIEGEPQSGKTCLLQKLQIDLHDINKLAIYLNAKEIKGIDAESYVKRALKSQFNKKENNFEEFLSTPINDRVVLIDDIEKCLINKDNKKVLLDRLGLLFSKIILISSNENEIHAVLKSENFYKDFSHFKILPLGRVKRNELIEAWIKLGKEFDANEEMELTHMIQSRFNKISELLGEHLIPPYPVFILTLLQSLSTSLNFNIEQTSYAYCYQSLIFVGLVKAGVEKDNLGSIINYLSQLAYMVHKQSSKKITRSDFESFYSKYKESYIMKYSSSKLLDILISSNLLQDDSDELKFSYKYLFYYLTAKKMANDFNQDIVAEVKLLCSELDIESNANIIIFLVHHTGHRELIDELLINSMLPFEKMTPITLNYDDSFFKFLNEFIKEISPEVIPRVKDHLDERKKRLQDEDDRERRLKRAGKEEKEEKIDEELKELIRVNKIIKILGQIVKNQQGSFEKSQLVDLLRESYLVCFRSINHVSEIIELAKPKIIERIVNDIDDQVNRDEIISRVKKVIHELGYRFCLQSFSNLSMSVGASNMDQIYDFVADEINTPAAKLISFTIKSYFGKLNVSDLEDLLTEFKNNPVATDILRGRVKSYLYQHPVDFKKEQRISTLCRFSLDSGKKLSYMDRQKSK